jgi:hypothetical protein
MAEIEDEDDHEDEFEDDHDQRTTASNEKRAHEEIFSPLDLQEPFSFFRSSIVIVLELVLVLGIRGGSHQRYCLRNGVHAASETIGIPLERYVGI